MRWKPSSITDNIKESLIQEEDGVADEAQLGNMVGLANPYALWVTLFGHSLLCAETLQARGVQFKQVK